MLVFRNFLEQDNGVTAIEYALIASLIAVVIVGAVTIVGSKMSAKYTAVANQLP